MKVTLDKVYPLAATADNAWRLMQDIEAVAGCMPGAQITERVDDTHYHGTITVRLGPATMSFKGEIEVLALDGALRRLHLLGKGTDTTGASAASMDLEALVREAGEAGAACELAGKSEVTMTGKAAALGGRLMGPVAEQMLKQFVANFSARLDAARSQDSQAPQGAATTTGARAAGATTGDAAGSPRSPADREAESTMSAPASPAPRAELNGLAFAWAILRDWLRGLFSRKAA
ncbi:carbon monoxide dehydrogenase [Burkholderia sp. WAC0059]|uniref:SRPBCC family protein n=1 Tax=Burkholderia sp. WAC0059 TaxID=2066022 RepID=UPI000C7F70FA|nr:SRPBCC family protein [Burkholderia sp. WAC0059]PLZ04056.1 carbon monoxide dehydrogenase [Burkholderia sp. WAC0059]